MKIISIKKNYRWPFQHMPQSHPSTAPISLQGRCSILHQIYRIGSSGFLFFIIIVSMKLSLKSEIGLMSILLLSLRNVYAAWSIKESENLFWPEATLKTSFHQRAPLSLEAQTRFEKAAPSNIDCVLRTFLKITCTSLLGSDYYTNIKTLVFLCLTISSQI